MRLPHTFFPFWDPLTRRYIVSGRWPADTLILPGRKPLLYPDFPRASAAADFCTYRAEAFHQTCPVTPQAQRMQALFQEEILACLFAQSPE